MALPTKISDINNAEYWNQVDQLFTEAEKKNLIESIKKSDTEKFYDFTAMMRVTNTLNRVKLSGKK